MTPVIIKQVMDVMKETTGVDLKDIIKANTYDAKTTRNINVTELGMTGIQQDAEAADLVE